MSLDPDHRQTLQRNRSGLLVFAVKLFQYQLGTVKSSESQLLKTRKVPAAAAIVRQQCNGNSAVVKFSQHASEQQMLLDARQTGR
jgi:hypothetical protein